MKFFESHSSALPLPYFLSLFLFLFLFSFLLPAQARADGPDAEKNVFSPDNRKPMLSTEFPYSAIVKIEIGDGWCTGSLVCSDLVLTNAHCILEKGKMVDDPIVVYPNYKKGKAPTKSKVIKAWWGTNDPDKDDTNDWAILRIKDSLGKKYGHFTVKVLPWNETTFSRPINTAGYSGDYREGETAGVHLGCKIHNFQEGLVYHDCDSTPGSSGSPIWQEGKSPKGMMQYQLIALDSAEFVEELTKEIFPRYSDEFANVAVPAAQFASRLEELCPAP